MLINTKTMEYYEITSVIHEGVWNLLAQSMPDTSGTFPVTLLIHQRVWDIRNDMYHTLTQLNTYPFDHYNQGDLC